MRSEHLSEHVAGRRFIGSLATHLVDAAHRRPWWFLAVYALATIFALRYTVNHLGINSYIQDMISEDLPWRQTFIEYHESFPQFVDNLLIVIDGLTPELAQAAQQKLANALERDRSGLFVRVFLPGAGPFFDRQGLLYLSTDELLDLSDRLAELQPVLAILARSPDLPGLAQLFQPASEDRANISLPALDRPLKSFRQSFDHTTEDHLSSVSWQGLLASGNQPVSSARRVILLETRRNFDRFLPGEAAINRVRELVASLELDPDHRVTVRLTGPVALEHEELQSVEQGSVLVGFLALALVSIVLLIAFRSFQLIAVSIITLLTGLIGTAAFAAFAVGNLNLISIAFGVLYIGLGIDFAIHFSMCYRELIGQGKNTGLALHETARDVGRSLVFCALTTSVGFFAFYPTDFVGVSELGLISGVGMYISLITSLTLLPALLTVWPSARKIAGPGRIRPRKPFANEPYGRYTRVLAGLLALLTLTQVGDLVFDNNPMNLRDPEAESVVAFEEMRSDQLATPMALSVLVDSLAAAEEKARQLDQLPEVGRTMTISNLVPDEQPQKIAIIDDLNLLLGSSLKGGANGSPTTEIGAKRAALESLISNLVRLESVADENQSGEFEKLRLAAETFRTELARLDTDRQETRLKLLETNLLGGLGQTLDNLRLAIMAEQFDLSDLPEEIASQWRTADGRYRIAIYPREDLANRESEEQFINAVRAEDPDATGIAAVEFEAGKLVVSAFRQALTTAVIFVFALLVLLIRNWRDPLLIMVPVVLSALLAVSVMVLSGMSLNFANIIALPLLFGIGVDNGIHIVHCYRMARPSKLNLMETSTVRAVFFGTLTTIVSFGSLALSSHYGMATMGQLLTIGMILTLFTTLIVLPTLLTDRAATRQ